MASSRVLLASLFVSLALQFIEFSKAREIHDTHNLMKRKLGNLGERTVDQCLIDAISEVDTDQEVDTSTMDIIRKFKTLVELRKSSVDLILQEIIECAKDD